MLQIFAIIDDTSVMNFRKNLQHNFLKMRGGGSKAVWNFSENSSVLEEVGIPQSDIQSSVQEMLAHLKTPKEETIELDHNIFGK